MCVLGVFWRFVVFSPSTVSSKIYQFVFCFTQSIYTLLGTTFVVTIKCFKPNLPKPTNFLALAYTFFKTISLLEEISLGKQTVSVQWFLSGYWFLSGHFQSGRRTERSVEVNQEIMWNNISQI